MPRSKLYYECHVTIEPVFDERLLMFEAICREFSFKPANLLMQKRLSDSPERSRYDTFATGRHPQYEVIEQRMHELIAALQLKHFKVWRYKIEDTILDVKLT